MTTTNPEPLFILSLPRSGSTLLQHLLAAHPKIAATAEPHILVPFSYALRGSGIAAEYLHDIQVKGMTDFLEQTIGLEGYRQRVRRWALEIYAAASDDSARYFLDKTPAYDLIAEDVLTTFSGSKAIVLWRNPLAVAASMLHSFGGWTLYPLAPHLFQGLDTLVQAQSRHRSDIIAVNYENLVQDPHTVLSRIFRYLNVEFDESIITGFVDVHLSGMGDPTWGRYSRVSPESLRRWMQTMRGPVRKAWCKRYLRWIGPERLSVMGYDYDELSSDVDALSNLGGHPLQDAKRISKAFMKAKIKSRLLKSPLHVWPPAPQGMSR